MAMMAIMLGILTTSIGLVGIYLGKVFSQVQNRPKYIVKDVYRASRPLVQSNSQAVAKQVERSS